MNIGLDRLLIYEGRIIDLSVGIDLIGSLLIDGGRIAWRGFGEGVIPPQAGYTPPPPYDILHVRRAIICPGFIDLHCHLRQPGFDAKETMPTGTQAAARGGFTTICCMPNTNPPLDSPDSIGYVREMAAREGIVRVLPIGCVSKGRRGEELVDMDLLASSGVIGFSDDGNPISNSRLMRQALAYSQICGLPIIDHCEDKVLTEGGQVNEGVVSDSLNLGGIPAVAEEVMVARDLALAQMTGGRLHIAHVSTEGSVELIRRAKEKGIPVTAEVTPHHLTLTEEKVRECDTNAKVNPPLRTEQDIRALVRGIRDNTIDVIATDHAPHAEADKRCRFSAAAFGISGFETALGSLMSLVHDGHLSLTTLIARLTCDPARIVGDRYGKLGTLDIGTLADVTIFNPDMEWVVDTRSFASKGKNTPLDGVLLKGKVLATVSRGKLVYKDDSIKFEKRIAA